MPYDKIIIKRYNCIILTQNPWFLLFNSSPVGYAYNGEADKLQEARFAVSLIRVLDGTVRRTTGGCSAAPLNGRTASVQHSFNLHVRLVRNVRLKRVLDTPIQIVNVTVAYYNMINLNTIYYLKIT